MDNNTAHRATPRFEDAFSSLTKAFFNNTLAKGSCSVCAVGNLVASANGIKLEIHPDFNIITKVPLRYKMLGLKHGVLERADNSIWEALFMTNSVTHSQRITTNEEELRKSFDDMWERLEAGETLGIDDVLRGVILLLGKDKYWQTRLNQWRGEAKLALEAIAATNYSMDELRQVENVFEVSTKIDVQNYAKHTEDEIKEDQFNGLVAVIELLCQLDGIDAAPYKEAFEFKLDPLFEPAHPELIPA